MTDPPNDAPRTGDAAAPANVSASRRRRLRPHHRPAAAELSSASDAMANLASAIRQLVQTEVAAQVAAALADRSAGAELPR